MSKKEIKKVSEKALKAAADRGEIPKKGWLESIAIRNILYMILTPIAVQVVASLPAIEEKIVALSPDFLDPAVHPLIAGVGIALTALFGLKAAKGVKAEASSAPTYMQGLVGKKHR